MGRRISPSFAAIPADLVSGIFQYAGRRGGFVVRDDRQKPDIHIPPESAGAALHGDHVQVTVTRARPGQDPRGEVKRILRHANHHIVGQIARMGRYAIVRPKSAKIDRLIEIHRKLDPAEVPDNSWVVVEIREWSDSPRQPLIGRLSEVLGLEGDRGLPILLLIREGGISPEFPEEVEAEAARIREAAARGESHAGRRDFRKHRVFTVDPITAKDFDDAISLEESPRADAWRIGVHIADVAHYVAPGSVIDVEAYERATSIYPVDRVIPMLPEALSNGLCSLRPDEDKMTMSVLFTINRTGRVSEVELCQSVIRSVRCFAYEEVQGLFEKADEHDEVAHHPRPLIAAELHADLMELRRASRALRRARMGRGALDLDLPETEVLFDANGAVTDLRRREHFEAHELIEEFMIAANEAVARELEKRELPALYRVHGEPDEEKLLTLSPLLSRFGIRIPPKGGISREQLQQALKVAREHPAGTVVQRLVLRSLMRARYQPENIGHYGLASDSYLHFTSPIRRYPDLVAHRAVKALLGGAGAASPAFAGWVEAVDAWGRHTSDREERAQKIEWNAQEILGMEFMRRYMGDIFDGYISGVVGRGFFVELVEYPVEGLVKIAQLDDDFYDLDDRLMIWRGRGSGKTFALGDPVTVMIERIDVMAGQMDFILLRKPRGSDGKRAKRTGRRAAPPKQIRRSGPRPGRRR